MNLRTISTVTITAATKSISRFDHRLLGLIGAVTAAATTVGLNI